MFISAVADVTTILSFMLMQLMIIFLLVLIFMSKLHKLLTSDHLLDRSHQHPALFVSEVLIIACNYYFLLHMLRAVARGRWKPTTADLLGSTKFTKFLIHQKVTVLRLTHCIAQKI